jgi:signal transduction histidine kinase
MCILPHISNRAAPSAEVAASSALPTRDYTANAVFAPVATGRGRRPLVQTAAMPRIVDVSMTPTDGLPTTANALLQLGALDKSAWQPALQRILRIDAETMAVDRASFWNLCEEPCMINCELGFIRSANAFEQGAIINSGDAPIYLAELKNERVMAIEDVYTDERTEALRAYCEARAISSMLDVPVWIESRLVGVPCHEHVGPKRRWTSSDIEFVLSVAQVVATALEARRRLQAEEASENACLMAHASLLVSRSLEPEVIAQEALRALLPARADWAAVDLIEGDSVRRLAIAHADPVKQALIAAYAKEFPPQMEGTQLPGQVVRLDQSLLFPEITDEIMRRYHYPPEHIEWLRRLGTRSAVAALIRVPDSVRAVLTLVSAKRTFNFGDLKVAEQFGERVGTALNNARLYRQATDALRARDEFLALAAHELRTPLTSLRVSCEHLLAQSIQLVLPAAVVKPAQRILRQSRRLTRLVNRMLDASLAEWHAPPIYPAPVDLCALVREVVDELGAGSSHLPIELQLPAAAVGQWDGDRLQQVIGNLVDNALKYGRGLPIRITVTTDADAATLIVADQGIGIDPELLPQVFEPYERGASSRNYGGLGLGLFVSRQIVAAHRGTLKVRSQKGIGTEFEVRLPLKVTQ